MLVPGSVLIVNASHTLKGQEVRVQRRERHRNMWRLIDRDDDAAT